MKRIWWRMTLWSVCPVLALTAAMHVNSNANGESKPAARGMALCIGLDSVDPAHYGGWSGPLNACEKDAKTMKAIVESNQFTANMLLTSAAKRDAVINGIKSAASQLASGDIFMLSYSGHGSQLPDGNGDELDTKDETWCLFDGELIDDELAALWPEFKSGVRILVFSDSCHSGTVTRMREYEKFTELSQIDPQKRTYLQKSIAAFKAEPDPKKLKQPAPFRVMPDSIAIATYDQNRNFYDRIGNAATKEKTSRDATKATVLLISGCQDNQLSLDGDDNGLFTGMLKSVWNSGGFSGDYHDFHEAILSLMPSHQSPNYYIFGSPNPGFEAQKPFSR